MGKRKRNPEEEFPKSFFPRLSDKQIVTIYQHLDEQSKIYISMVCKRMRILFAKDVLNMKLNYQENPQKWYSIWTRHHMHRIDSFSVEILHHIFSFLDYKDVVKFASTCKLLWESLRSFTGKIYLE